MWHKMIWDGTGIKFTKESLSIEETFIIIVSILLNEFLRNKVCCTKYAYKKKQIIFILNMMWVTSFNLFEVN